MGSIHNCSITKKKNKYLDGKWYVAIVLKEYDIYITMKENKSTTVHDGNAQKCSITKK